MLGCVLLCLPVPLDEAHQLLLALLKQLREVSGRRQESELIRAIEEVLLHSSAADAAKAIAHVTLPAPQQQQRRVPEIGDAEAVATPSETCDQRCGGAEGPGAAEAAVQSVECPLPCPEGERGVSLQSPDLRLTPRHELVRKATRVKTKTPLPLTHTIGDAEANATGIDEAAVSPSGRGLVGVRSPVGATHELQPTLRLDVSTCQGPHWGAAWCL
mmetsp:Transcript_110898/g.236875  ORF Transcript_110898/g.236875 Transcript_110898/m.236875 type:complete len:215 (+) Transcript_110898:509-1153(+)